MLDYHSTSFSIITINKKNYLHTKLSPSWVRGSYNHNTVSSQQ